MKYYCVEQRAHPINLDVPKWCFTMGKGGTVVGVGHPGRRWWDTKDELVAKLLSLGISSADYDICEGLCPNPKCISAIREKW